MSRPKLNNQPLKFIKGFHIAGVLIRWVATSLLNSGDFMLQKIKSRTHIPIIKPIPITNTGVPIRFSLVFGKFPICIAKTQYSFSTDPNLKGAPSGHVLPIREVRLSSGAEFIVVICGTIMTMPGLPRVPAADFIKLNDKGDIEGLF